MMGSLNSRPFGYEDVSAQETPEKRTPKSAAMARTPLHLQMQLIDMLRLCAQEQEASQSHL